MIIIFTRLLLPTTMLLRYNWFITCGLHFFEVCAVDIFLDHFQGSHALVYDAGTANETWEWVNLAEVDN